MQQAMPLVVILQLCESFCSTAASLSTCASPLQSLLNQQSSPVYYASLIPPYVVMVIMGVWAYVIAGGSPSNLRAFVTGKQAGYTL